MSVTKEQRTEWERMGLCTECGGLKLDPKFRMCVRCRDKKRDYMRGLYAKDYPKSTPDRIKVRPEIRKNHKCWNCEWGRYATDRFFCPFVEGTCVKTGTMNGIEKEKHDED